MSEVQWIRPGIEFTWQGSPAVIQKVAAQVEITAPDGTDPTAVPIAEIASALRGPVGSCDLARLHDIEEHLSQAANARLAEETNLLHIMLTGRRVDQPDTDPPPADLDPARTTPGQRRRRLAALLAEQARTQGKRAGMPVLVKSEMRRLQRIAKRWQDEQNLLDPRYGRPRTHRTSPEVMEVLLAFLNDHALKSTKSNTALVRAFRIYCAKQQPQLELPSETMLQTRVKELRSGWSHLGATAKNRISELNVPETSGMIRLATRPGELVLFDTTKANVWVKDPRTGSPYRLDVTLAIDLATRCIVGLAITDSTTQFAVGLCLADVLRPKTAALANTWAVTDGEPVEQPFIGRPNAFLPFYSAAFHPEGVVVDNGKQYVSRYLTAQMARLGIHFEPQRSYNPTDKPQVERVFRTVKDMFESLMPGFTGGSVHEKGKDPSAEELMSAEAYERRLRQCIDLYNHRTHHGLVLPEDPFARLSPFLMYGILAEKVGAIPDVEFQHEWIRFLPTVTVRVRPSKVRVCRLDYKSPSLRTLQGDPQVSSTGKLRVYYDPFDLRITWCFDSDGTLHPLRWHLLRPDTPRFGTFHTTHVVEQFADRKISTATAERILVDIFTGKYDDPDADTFAAQTDTDPLIQARAAKLTEEATRPPGIELTAERWIAPPARPAVAANTTARSRTPPDVERPALGELRIQADPRDAGQPPIAAAPRPRRALQPYGQDRSR
jgi:putative transposase